MPAGSQAKKGKTVGRAAASPGKVDKIHSLERENTTLKTKENLLSDEIGKMKTKMRRLEEMIKKRSNAGNDSVLPAEIQN
jgi:predicted nuclease with TOPRIM domain